MLNVADETLVYGAEGLATPSSDYSRDYMYKFVIFFYF